MFTEYLREVEKRDTQYYTFRSQWFYNILIAGCGFLGALIALSDNSEAPFHIRLAFLLSIAIGILGVVFLAIALLFETVLARRTRSEIRRNIPGKNKNGGDWVPVAPPNFLIYFGIIGCISLFLFLISIFYYVVAKNLPEWIM